jgi:hypothetical protein
MSDFQDGHCIVPMPRAIPVALQGIRLFFGFVGCLDLASLGVGISTAMMVCFVTGHGSSIALTAGNLLTFIYGIGLLM